MKRILHKIELFLVKFLVGILKWMGRPSYTNIDFLVILVVIALQQTYKGWIWLILWMVYLIIFKGMFEWVSKEFEGVNEKPTIIKVDKNIVNINMTSPEMINGFCRFLVKMGYKITKQ